MTYKSTINSFLNNFTIIGRVYRLLIIIRRKGALWCISQREMAFGGRNPKTKSQRSMHL